MSCNATKAPMPAQGRFRQVPKDENDVVRLTFLQTTEKRTLYAAHSVLRLWSGVLRNAIDAAAAEPAGLRQLHTADAKTDCVFAAIQLDDTDTAAWEDALGLMYPSVPVFQVAWESASRLLVLADKYDMPCITDLVRLFLSEQQQGSTTRLQQHLTKDNVLEWLGVTSRVGLAECASHCVAYIVSNNVPLMRENISHLQPDTLQQICQALQQQVVANKETLSTRCSQLLKETSILTQTRKEVIALKRKLAEAPKPTQWVCSGCEYKLFKKHNGECSRRGGFFCLNCGAHAKSASTDK